MHQKFTPISWVFLIVQNLGGIHMIIPRLLHDDLRLTHYSPWWPKWPQIDLKRIGDSFLASFQLVALSLGHQNMLAIKIFLAAQGLNCIYSNSVTHINYWTIGQMCKRTDIRNYSNRFGLGYTNWFPAYVNSNPFLLNFMIVSVTGVTQKLLSYHKFWGGPLTRGGWAGWETAPWTWDKGPGFHFLSAEHFSLDEIRELKLNFVKYFYWKASCRCRHDISIVKAKVNVGQLLWFTPVMSRILKTFITRLRPE